MGPLEGDTLKNLSQRVAKELPLQAVPCEPSGFGPLVRVSLPFCGALSEAAAAWQMSDPSIWLSGTDAPAFFGAPAQNFDLRESAGALSSHKIDSSCVDCLYSGKLAMLLEVPLALEKNPPRAWLVLSTKSTVECFCRQAVMLGVRPTSTETPSS